VLLVHASAHIT